MNTTVVLLMLFIGAADDSKVDPAKIYREKQRAEQKVKELEEELNKLRAELSVATEAKKLADESNANLRTAIVVKLGGKKELEKLTDNQLIEQLTAGVTKPQKNEAIETAIKEGRLHVGMTMDEAQAAVAVLSDRAWPGSKGQKPQIMGQSGGTTFYRWTITYKAPAFVPGADNRPRPSGILEASFVDGKLRSFQKIR